MAKKAKIEKNKKRLKLVAQHAERRHQLKQVIRNPRSSPEQRESAQLELHRMPRDSSPVRVRNRCMLTGRPRGYVGRFGLSRIAFREMALAGQIPGVRKASW
jgi:small subunit ribosomal protein S14